VVLNSEVDEKSFRMMCMTQAKVSGAKLVPLLFTCCYKTAITKTGPPAPQRSFSSIHTRTSLSTPVSQSTTLTSSRHASHHIRPRIRGPQTRRKVLFQVAVQGDHTRQSIPPTSISPSCSHFDVRSSRWTLKVYGFTHHEYSS